jgi:hypothetical protein
MDHHRFVNECHQPTSVIGTIIMQSPFRQNTGNRLDRMRIYSGNCECQHNSRGLAEMGLARTLAKPRASMLNSSRQGCYGPRVLLLPFLYQSVKRHLVPLSFPLLHITYIGRGGLRLCSINFHEGGHYNSISK